MKASKLSSIMALAVLSVSPCARATYSYSASIMELVSTGDAVPGIGGTFTSFSAPTTDRDVDRDTGINPFWFIATSSNGNSGVFVYDAYFNDMVDLVDTTMTAPTGGTFASFSNLSSGLGAVGFVGTDTNGVQGVYGIGDVPLTLIATSNTNPANGVTLGNIQGISITGSPYGAPGGILLSNAGPYEFLMNYDGTYASYSFNQSAYTSFGPVSYKGSIGNSNIPGLYLEADAFSASSGGTQSIYYGGPDSTHNYTVLANVGGSIPTGTGRFTSFGNPYVTANEVAFTAHYTTTGSDDQQGIFVYGGYISGGTDSLVPPPSLKQIVATGQLAPNSHGATFTGFSELSDTSYDTTFLASLSDGNEGLYINVNPNPPYIPEQIIKVIETGDLLDGKTIDGISLAPDASNLSDETDLLTEGYTNVGIGFQVDFTDGSEGLYYFTVSLPEPGLFCLLPLSTLLFRRRR